MDVVGNAGHMFSLSKSFCMDCSEMLLAPRASRGIHGTGLVLRMSGSLPSANVGTAVSTAGMRRPLAPRSSARACAATSRSS